MKILCSVYACIPNRGSEPGHGWYWVLENAKMGHEVWCFTLPKGKAEIEAELLKYPTLKIHPVYIDVPGWVNDLYRYQPGVYLHYLYWQHIAVKRALKEDKQVNFDLVMHLTLGSLQMGSEMWKLKKPFIFGPVGGGCFPPEAFKKYFHHKWKAEVVRKWISKILLAFNPHVRRSIEHAGLTLVANTDTLALAKRFRSPRTEMFLDVGLPESFFPNQVKKKGDPNLFKILWVGRIFGRKGLPLVMEALSKVRKDIPFQLTIIGDGDLRDLVPVWIAQYGLQDKTVLRGQIPWTEVRQAYEDHDVFMFCSLRDTSGTQFLEAMAYSLPIITLDHQGAGDHVPADAGIKVPVTTPEETVPLMAAAVETLYDSPERREQMGASGLRFVKTHTWEAKAVRMAEYYRQLLGAKAETKQGIETPTYP